MDILISLTRGSFRFLQETQKYTITKQNMYPTTTFIFTNTKKRHYLYIQLRNDDDEMLMI